MLFRYFEEDDEEQVPDLAYIPAPGSPTYDEMQKNKSRKVEEEEDDDPLDAYMAGIEQQVFELTSVQFSVQSINSI